MDYDHLGSFHRWVGWLVFCTSHRGSGLPDTVQQQPNCHWKHWNAKVASVDPGVSHGLECWIVFLVVGGTVGLGGMMRCKTRKGWKTFFRDWFLSWNHGKNFICGELWGFRRIQKVRTVHILGSKCMETLIQTEANGKHVSQTWKKHLEIKTG